MTMGRRNTRFRVHYMVTRNPRDEMNSDTMSASYDVSVFSATSAIDATKTMLKTRFGDDCKIVIGKIKVLKQIDSMNFHMRGK